MEKIVLKFQRNWSYGSPKNRNAKQKRTEREIQSQRGSRSSGSHGGQGAKGGTSPHLGWRPWRKKPEGGGLSHISLSRWCRSAAGGTIIATIVFINIVAFANISITFPHLYPAVHSPATHCTLYLNMVLYASYYYPMMCCHPMMSE